jgi:hypothetical protein
LLDGADRIDLPHLEAALVVWEYCESSAVHIFGGAIGDPVADEILRALQNAPQGMTRTEISNLFGRHQSSSRIGAALQMLDEGAGAARDETDQRAINRNLVRGREMNMGRYLEIFRQTPTERERSEESEKSNQSSTYLREKPDLFRNNQEVRNEACEITGTSFAANPLAKDLFRISRFLRIFQELERRCPAHVDPADWVKAIEDGRKFLACWGQQAEALGWTGEELFGHTRAIGEVLAVIKAHRLAAPDSRTPAANPPGGFEEGAVKVVPDGGDPKAEGKPAPSVKSNDGPTDSTRLMTTTGESASGATRPKAVHPAAELPD